MTNLEDKMGDHNVYSLSAYRSKRAYKTYSAALHIPEEMRHRRRKTDIVNWRESEETQHTTLRPAIASGLGPNYGKAIVYGVVAMTIFSAGLFAGSCAMYVGLKIKGLSAHRESATTVQPYLTRQHPAPLAKP